MKNWSRKFPIIVTSRPWTGRTQKLAAATDSCGVDVPVERVGAVEARGLDF